MRQCSPRFAVTGNLCLAVHIGLAPYPGRRYTVYGHQVSCAARPFNSDIMRSPNLSFDKDTFAIVDTETTGTSPGYNRIIEIGIVRVEKGKVVETFESL